MPKNANVGFLKHAEAAGALAVDVRTIERWLARQETREALGAVRQGKRWCIPRPESLFAWESQTRERLKKLGICPPKAWERELEQLDKECDRYLLESYRLWLAAYMKVLGRGSITQEARDAILLLWQVACELLGPLPRHEMEVDKLKRQFPARLLARRFDKVLAATRFCSAKEPVIFRLIIAVLLDVHAVMRYWPGEKHFKHVRAAYTLDKLEEIRGSVDFQQAVRELEQIGQKPTAENVRPLLHKDFLAHINDTREKLPGIVVKNPTSEELQNLTLASFCSQNAGKNWPLVTLDFRQPQDGLTLRTFRRRHPLRQQQQRDIVNAVYGVRDSLPGV